VLGFREILSQVLDYVTCHARKIGVRWRNFNPLSRLTGDDR